MSTVRGKSGSSKIALKVCENLACRSPNLASSPAVGGASKSIGGRWSSADTLIAPRGSIDRPIIDSDARSFRNPNPVAPDPMHQIARAIETHGIRIERQPGRNSALRQSDIAATIFKIGGFCSAVTDQGHVEMSMAAVAQR